MVPSDVLLVVLCSGWSAAPSSVSWICQYKHRTTAARALWPSNHDRKRVDSIMKENEDKFNWDDAEDWDPDKPVQLSDKENKGPPLKCRRISIPCDVNDGTYVGLAPWDMPVALAEMRDDGPVPLTAYPGDLMKRCSEACKDKDIELIQSAFMLVARGPGVDSVFNDQSKSDDDDVASSDESRNDKTEDEYDDDDYEYEDGEETFEEAMKRQSIELARVEHKGKEVVVLMPLAVVAGGYLIGKEVGKGRFESIPNKDEESIAADIIKDAIIDDRYDEYAEELEEDYYDDYYDASSVSKELDDLYADYYDDYYGEYYDDVDYDDADGAGDVEKDSKPKAAEP